MTIRICVSVLPSTVNEAIELIAEAESHRADFVEVRLDKINKLGDIADIANSSRVPLIATNRSIALKGHFNGAESDRQETLVKAVESGFEYADFELETKHLKKKTADLRATGAKTIVSFHDFQGTSTPSKLEGILRKELANGADVCKIVTMAKSAEDNITTLRFVSDACRDANIICFCMGRLGRISRILSPMFGGFLTIASLDQGRETAPGQFAVAELKRIYETLGEAAQ